MTTVDEFCKRKNRGHYYFMNGNTIPTPLNNYSAHIEDFQTMFNSLSGDWAMLNRILATAGNKSSLVPS